MLTLEQTLEEIEKFRADLNAVIVLEPEISHEDDECICGRQGAPSDCYLPEKNNSRDYQKVKIVDKPAVTKPDTDRRRVAREGLRETFKSCKWISGRYEAGKALDVSKQEIDKQVKEWVWKLTEDLRAEEVVDTYVHHYRTSGGPSTHEQDFYEDVEIKKPDIRVREKALSDLVKLSKLSDSPEVEKLFKTTYWFNKAGSVRRDSGRELGYSGLRIWLHELSVWIGYLF